MAAMSMPRLRNRKKLRRKKPAKKVKQVSNTKIGKKQTPVKKVTKAVKEKGGNTAVKKAVKKRADDSFEFRAVKDYTKPRFYGEKTLYTDKINQKWRIKPGKGRRDHQQFSFKTDPRATWNDVVKALKK